MAHCAFKPLSQITWKTGQVFAPKSQASKSEGPLKPLDHQQGIEVGEGGVATDRPEFTATATAAKPYQLPADLLLCGPQPCASQPPGKALGSFLAGMGGGQAVIRLGDLTPAKGPAGLQQLCLPDPQGGAAWWKHSLSHS